MRACLVLALAARALTAAAACTANTTSTAALQALLKAGGAGHKLSLCPNQQYELTAPLNFTAASQEISTEGYPTGNTRATLVVTGVGQCSAVMGTDADLDGVKLRNVQINGNRGSSDIYTNNSANIEMGGDNNGQLIEYVRSYDPRGWSCLHLAEGTFKCANATVQNNDIGPCGHELFQNWADGVSLSCASSLVQNNVVTDATDGGIVIFGAPRSTIRNNTISVRTRTMLGGINLVDVTPWEPYGNYSGTLVEDNVIMGGFATGYGNATLGTNNVSAVIKIGIGIGPDVWFGTEYGQNKSTGGTVRNNALSGAFSFGVAVGAAKNFIVENNTFFGNVSFVGDYGANCTTGANTPHAPVALLEFPSSLTNVTIADPSPASSSSSSSAASASATSTAATAMTSSASRLAALASTTGDDFAWTAGTALGLTCFVHPAASAFAWPYGAAQVDAESAQQVNSALNGATGAASAASGSATSAAVQATGSASATSAGTRIDTSGLSLAVLLATALGGALLA
ncbi:hypothetical protein Q5752_002315 [Cryptotrichosporon argae]